ncbi:MAG TPA: TolC family protein [Candidatus Krumholzibacteria bacterium]|nr:TolC family protein [Candidatus Krumholzibacteria bacterium]
MTLLASLILAFLLAAPPSYVQEQEVGAARPVHEADAPRPQHAETSASLYGGSDSLLVVIEGPADTVLSLNQCIEQSIRSNDQLQVEHERLNELRAKKVQARADGLPSLDLVGNYSRGRDPSFALDSTFGGGGGGGFGPVSTGNAAFDSLFTEAMGQLFAGDNGGFIPAPENIPAQTFWRASADLSWELHPTRVIYALKAANIAIDQQELVIEDTENRTIEDTMQRYYSVLSAQAQVRSLQAELDARREFLDISRRRYFLGLSTGLDTLQARVRLMNLVPQLRRAQQDVADAGAQLNIQMGRDAHTPLQILEEFQIETDPVELDRAVALAMKRPDITKSELSEDYLHHERDTLKSEMHPYLRLNAAYGYVTRDLSEFTNRGHDFWNTGVSLTVPLFDGFLTKGRVHERDAAIRRTQHQTSGLRKDAEAEVISALGELKIARANLSAAKLNREQAEEALKQMNRRYELGKAGYLDVLNAQSARFTARSNLIQAYHDVLAWTATLKRAMGVPPTRPLSEIQEIQP